MHARPPLASAVALSITAALACPMPAAGQPRLIELPPDFGGLGSRAHAISADGSTQVGRSDDPGQNVVRWMGGGEPDLLGTTILGYAQDVSGDGSVIVGYDYGAFRYTDAEGLVILDELPIPGVSLQVANGVSADGSTIVGYAQTARLRRPFVWTASTGVRALPLAGDADLVEAHAVSGDGAIIAGESGGQAAIWDADRAITVLGVPAGAASSHARAVSDDGLVVAGFIRTGIDRGAFRWTAASGFEPLPLPAGAVGAEAVGISGDGRTIVGSVDAASGPDAAALWSPGLGVVDLNAYLLDAGLDLIGWRLTRATDASFDGTAIVGVGLLDGQQRGFLVTGLPATCRADLDDDGRLTLFDFLAFQTLFDAGDPAADFDDDGRLTFFDFLAFQTAFDAGCE
ncbi:MAG: GC-type dockerin domain-anchored protein [Planctomycetota bacterium]